jgi:hypothetical protein
MGVLSSTPYRGTVWALPLSSGGPDCAAVAATQSAAIAIAILTFPSPFLVWRIRASSAPHPTSESSAEQQHDEHQDAHLSGGGRSFCLNDEHFRLSPSRPKN